MNLYQWIGIVVGIFGAFGLFMAVTEVLMEIVSMWLER